MPAWFIPALKAVLPHLGTIITAARPVFTNRKTGSAAVAELSPNTQIPLSQQQITELQAAVSQNADNIRELATQLQQTVSALEQAAAEADKRMRRALVLSTAALLMSLLALALTIAA